MTQDYSGQNLRGHSFKGQNLEGVNFTAADIRSADFTDAKLKGANFSDAKAGLKKRWATFLVIVSWVLLGFSGLISTFASYLVALQIFDEEIASRIIGWFIVVILIIFCFVTIRQGIQASLGAFTFIFPVAVALVFAVTFAGAFAGTFPGAFVIAKAIAGTTFAGTFAVTLAGAFAFAVLYTVGFAGYAAVVGSVAFAAAFAFAIAVAIAVAIVGAFAFTGAFAFAVVVALSGIGTGTQTGGTVAGAEAFTLLSIYISWRSLKGDPKYALIRDAAIFFAAFRGTSFRSADLTNANFTDAILKSTDFREAILTRTCFHKTKKLDRIRPGITYLKDKKLRQLLVRGSCSEKDFNNKNLRGLNLSGANLANASFIGTDFYQSSLKEADLTGALLVRTQFESTDLTGATLTGACIEDWVVTSTTKLNGIECKYIFMKYADGDKRDKIPPKGEFKNDDFILFVQSILDTIKLYHERDVNPKLALYVLQTLSEDYQCTLEIVKIEKRGESGAIIEVKIPGSFNQEKLKETYYEKYNQYLKFYMTDPKNELKSSTNIENVTVHKGFLIGGNVSNSTVGYTIDTEGDTIMSEGFKQQFNNDLRNAQFAGGLVNADKVEAGQIGGNINNYTPQQRQNLAEAAAEIQQLLQQLEQTNPPTTNEAVTEAIFQEIRQNPTLKARLQSALRGCTKSLK